MDIPSFPFEIPPFEPHPALHNRHLQTLVGNFLPDRRFPYQAVQHRVRLADGDQIVLHDDTPSGWEPGGRVALLLHGLAGSFESTYMVRIAGKLKAAGVRTFRMDLRGSGAGEVLASHPYHGGRSEDARAALKSVSAICPESPATLIGFSLSGNIVLKLLGENPSDVPPNVKRAAVVCPSVDLRLCAQSTQGLFQRVYDRVFLRLVCRQIVATRRRCQDLPPVHNPLHLKTVFEFDDAYIGPVCGFGNALEFYAANSAAPHVHKIRVPTLILAAADDPMVPVRCFRELRLSPQVLLHITEHGGHLGFIGKRGIDADRRWMDWRIVDWTCR